MASRKQIAANRANAKRSTGPKSLSGKAHSSLNSCKHGLTAKTIVIGEEDPDEFDALRQRLFEEFNPRTGFTSELVGRLAVQMWRLRRVPAFEAALITAHCAEIGPTKDARALILEIEYKKQLELARRLQIYLPENSVYPEIREKYLREKQERNSAKGDSTTDKVPVENSTWQPEAPIPPPEPQDDPTRRMGLALIRDGQHNNMLGKLAQYEAGLMNGVIKTLRMLEFLQDRETRKT
jgi:hypothetical protein